MIFPNYMQVCVRFLCSYVYSQVYRPQLLPSMLNLATVDVFSSGYMAF